MGTGSIAVALQHFDAIVLGSDLDSRVICGTGIGRKNYNLDQNLEICQKEFNVTTNFDHYKLPQPEFF